MRPDPLLQLSGIGLDPTENGGVVNLHPAIEQHQFEIAVADWEHQVPPDRPQNHLIGKLPSLELLAPTHCRPALRLRRANPTGPAPSAKPCNRAHITDRPRPNRSSYDLE